MWGAENTAEQRGCSEESSNRLSEMLKSNKLGLHRYLSDAQPTDIIRTSHRYAVFLV